MTQKKKNDQKSLIFCCYHDMCNHVDSPQTKNLINNTLLADTLDNSRESRLSQHIEDAHQPLDYSNSQVWFRAATIAVPVCGAVILFVLIALAVKILRSENQNSVNHKLGYFKTKIELGVENKMFCFLADHFLCLRVARNRKEDVLTRF